MAEQLSEVGVILLMFGVGLHFHLKDLLAVRGVAIPGAVLQSAAATLAGLWLFQWIGLEWGPALVLGMALAVASTVVLVRVLSDSGQLHSASGRVAVGWLVMEDIFTIFAMVLLPAWFGAGAGGSTGMAAVFITFKLAIFVGVTLVAGARAAPWLLNKIADTRSRELFTLGVLAIALGVAVSSTLFFGVSMALGAFLAGMVVGQSDFSARAGAEALPLRDAFAVMFFLSVGMLFDPGQALASPLLTGAALLIVMVVKPIAALLVVAALGYGSSTGLCVALALSQIGEFSFLLAAVGRQLGLLDTAMVNAMIAAAIISIMLNPAVFRTAAPVERFLSRHPRIWKILNWKLARRSGTKDELHEHLPAHRAIVVGYGPIGQMVSRVLRQRGIEPVIVEMNVETFRRLRAEGWLTVHGDANRAEVLEQAGAAEAASLILSASGSAANIEAVRLAREINPRIHVISRADFLGETPKLRQAGADEVFSSEGEVALAVMVSLLEHLGATPDQLDEARADVRARLA